MRKGKPVMIPGEPILIAEYSDRLGEVLLKGRRPEFRDKQQLEVNAQVDGTLTITLAQAQQMANHAEDEVGAYRKKRGLPPPQSEEHLG